jgi:glycosyltransferase involved in cell wall biosynthesis
MSKSLLVQFLKYLEFVLGVLKRYRGNDVGVVVVHSLGLLPLGLLCKKLFRAKLVYDAHELETEVHGLKGLRKKLSKLVERNFISGCDFIIVVSTKIQEWYIKNLRVEPIVVLNAPPLKIISTPVNLKEMLGLNPTQKLCIYQGLLNKSRGVEDILDAFLHRTDDVYALAFMGYGEMEEQIKEAADASPNVYYLPAVPPENVLNYTAGADIGIHLIHNTCLNHDYCMPNKLFEYLMAGLNVIVSPVTEMGEIVKGNNVGYVLSDDKNLAAALNEVLNNFDTEGCKERSVNALEFSKRNCWEVQEQKLLAAYCGIGIE